MVPAGAFEITPEAEEVFRNDDLRRHLKLQVLRTSVSQSFIGAAHGCPRKAFFRYRVGLQGKGYKRACSLGTMVHVGNALAVQSGKVELEPIHAKITEIGNKEKTTYSHYSKAMRGLGTPLKKSLAEFSEEIDRDVALATAMSVMFSRNALSSMGTRYKPLIVEKRLKVFDPVTECELEGTMDMVLLDEAKDALYIWDYKTSSTFPGEYKGMLRHNIQLKFYRLLLTLAVQSGKLFDKPYKVAGFVHDIMIKPTIRLKRNQTFPDYVAEVTEYYSGKGRHEERAAVWATNPPMDRFSSTFVSESPYDASLVAAILHAKRLAIAAPLARHYPEVGSATGQCTKSFGSPCEFRPLCDISPVYWQAKIPAMYQVMPDQEVIDLVSEGED